MFSFLSSYKLLIEVATIGLLFSGAVFGVHKFLEHEQGIGYQRAVAEYTAKQLAAEKLARLAETSLRKQLEDAQNAATQRDQTNAAFAATAAAASVGLRNTVADLRRSLPAASAASARQTADSFAAVFADCQGKYRAVAAAADGHLSDVKTLTEGWPRLEQQP